MNAYLARPSNFFVALALLPPIPFVIWYGIAVVPAGEIELALANPALATSMVKNLLLLTLAAIWGGIFMKIATKISGVR